MRIALCCNKNSEELRFSLEYLGEVLLFLGAWDRPPSVQLAESLVRGEQYDLAVVALDGLEGMCHCRKIKIHKNDLPILWISNQSEFWTKSRLIGVEEFLVKPLPNGMLQKVAKHLLEKSKE